MGSLGETFRDTGGMRRLYVGTGLLLLGAAVAAPGLVRVAATGFAGLGVAEDAALRAGIGVAGIALPAVFVAFLFFLDGDRRLRRVGAVGGAVAGVTALLHGLIGPLGAAAPPLWLAIPYLAGLGVAVYAPVATAAAATQDGASTRGFTASSGPAWQRSSGPVNRRVPADGGTEDDDLSFPLDRED